MYDTQAASNVETQTDFSYCMSVPEMLLQIRLERLSLVRFTGEKKKTKKPFSYLYVEPAVDAISSDY